MPCPHIGTKNFKSDLNDNTKTALQKLHSNTFNLVKKFPMCRILILDDVRPMVKFPTV